MGGHAVSILAVECVIETRLLGDLTYCEIAVEGSRVSLNFKLALEGFVH
jgi:hypothetical protein